jgi:hypothetical protein
MLAGGTDECDGAGIGLPEELAAGPPHAVDSSARIATTNRRPPTRTFPTEAELRKKAGAVIRMLLQLE